MPHRTDARCYHSTIIVVLLITGAVLAGCAGTRPKRTQEELLALRNETDARLAEQTSKLIADIAAHAKSEIDQNAPGAKAPTLDVLVISGGGDWGAFGAGVLKGWGRVPPGEMARPKFDVVTGVSTGALIAPFAFLGSEKDLDRILHLYRNPQKDWVKQRGMLYFLPNNLSFAEIPGLEREMNEAIDEAMLKRIVEGGREGRVLLVNTTNIDDGGMHVWDAVIESQRALDTGDIDRIHRIFLASAGIPGAFPAREIDGELYVDGGVTGNILYGARMREEDSIPAVWARNYPDQPQPKIRFWVIFNNKIRPTPQVTPPTWPPIVGRSVETATRFATITALRQLFAQAEIARLKRQAGMEVRLIAVPNDWEPPKPGVFIKETMNNLADLGEKMGADSASWQTESP